MCILKTNFNKVFQNLHEQKYRIIHLSIKQLRDLHTSVAALKKSCGCFEVILLKILKDIPAPVKGMRKGHFNDE